MSDDVLRKLPRVDVLAAALDPTLPHARRVRAARAVIDEARAELRGGASVDVDGLVARARDWMAEAGRGRLRRVINATGVIVHTNLGRAPLSLEGLVAAVGYTNLEYDLEAGARGSRRGLVEPLVLELFAAPAGYAALVANNNAAAIMLALAALIGEADEVIVSRGELVEIGGSFRVPDVLAASGARLVEVGTTNRTYAADYARAIGPKTVALLRVHPSNYRISGFVARPTVAELVAVADGRPVLVDLGSDVPGALPASLERDAERAHEALAAGADLVCFSGDKLLGGPQSGIVIGRASIIERMARHPLMRALRPDKLALGALEHTLRAYAADPATIPVHAMLHADPALLHARATALAAHVGGVVVATADPIGGGSNPDVTLEGWGVAIADAPPSLAAALRASDPPIIALTRGAALILALRTVPAADDEQVALAVNRVLDSLDARR